MVEDYARMVLGDAHLSRQLKQLRHDLTEAVASIDPAQRIANRDTVGDVGTTIQIDAEYQRDDPETPSKNRPTRADSKNHPAE